MTPLPDPIEVQPRRVQLASVEALPGGDAFVLGLLTENQDLLRVELPCWTVHQLMRVLPRLDAALAQARGEPPAPPDADGAISPINRVKSARHARSAVASTRR